MLLDAHINRLSTLACLSLLFACGGPSNSQDVAEIESSYGAVTTEDEEPLFGDARVAEEDARHRELADRPDPTLDREGDRPPERPSGCRGGQIRARVTPLGEDGVGRFFGVFTNGAGERVGHVRGLYGHRENGRQVVFGKMISQRGRFEARIRGLWERTDRNEVTVRARFHASRARVADGVIHGRIIDDDTRGRTLIARWGFDCDGSIDRERLPPERDDEERARELERSRDTVDRE